MNRFITLLIIFSLCNALHAQDSTIKKFDDWLRKKAPLDSSLAAKIDQAVTTRVAENPQITEKQIQYYNFTIDHRIRVFKWQFYSSVIIFFVVILIVLCGLYLSYRQFKLSAAASVNLVVKPGGENQKAADQLTGGPPAVPVETDLEITKDGVKIKTAVIGLAILVISIAFFYLYLQFVFPISILQ